MTLRTYETVKRKPRSGEFNPARATKKLGGGTISLVERAAIRREERLTKMVEALPDFVSAQNLLDQQQSGHPSLKKTNIRGLKKTTVEFNGLLHDIADHDASIRVTDIRNRVMRNSAIISDTVSPALVWNYVENSICGMRNETAFDGVTCYIDGVEDVRSGTVEEDLKGIDRFVSYRGEEIPVDIKASPEAALRAIKDRIEHDNYKSIPVWSGFSSKDFNGGLRVSDPARMSEPAKYIEYVLETAYTQGNMETIYMLKEYYSDLIEQKKAKKR